MELHFQLMIYVVFNDWKARISSAVVNVQEHILTNLRACYNSLSSEFETN